MAFTVAACQFAPQKGQTDANLDTIAAMAREASGEGADLVVYPESAVTGYFLESGVTEHTLSAGELCARLSERLRDLDRPVDLLVGFYESASGQPYNSAAYLTLTPSGSSVVHVYRKFFLPTYGVFDEERFHSRGLELGVFDTRLGRFGVLICEDVWHSVMSTLCAMAGAEVLLVPSASPARGFTGEKPSNVLRYERMLRAISEEHGIFAVNAQLTGSEGGKGFVGGSSITDPFGNQVVQGPLGEDAIVMAEIDLDLIRIARGRTPLIDDLKAAWGEIQRLADEV